MPTLALAALTRKIENSGLDVVRNDDPSSYDEFRIAGMELRDYSQTIVVGGEVNVTFFVADTHHERILARETAKDNCPPGIRIASLRAMSCLKAVIASSRSSSRDWFDLYVLEKERGFGIAEWKTAYKEAGLSNTSLEGALDRICSGRLPPSDPGFSALMDTPPSVAEIAIHFQQCRRIYEETAARTALRQAQQGRAEDGTDTLSHGEGVIW